MLRASSLSPFGPIFAKELRVSSRRKRTYFLRVLYLAALLLSLLLAYTSVHHSYGPSGVAARVQEQGNLGNSFFFGFSIFCFVAMCAICPILTSTAISSERLGKTLSVLLMTPINGWQIIAGKLFSRLLIALTLIGLSLPVLALVRLLGGVELSQMIGVLCLCTCTALSTAALGLFLSTFLNRSYVVILLSYGLILIHYMFVPMILMMLMSAGRRGPPRMDVFGVISPFLSILFVAEPMFTFGSTWATTWIGASLLQLLEAAGLVVCSALVLRRIARRAGEPAAPQSVQSGSTPTPQTNESAARRRSRREVSDDPIAWREIRRPLMSKPWHRVVAVIVLVGGLLATYFSLAVNRALGEWEVQTVYAAVFNALIWLLVAVLAATAISQEKESDTWTLLLATPLSGWDIVRGKVLGLLRRLIWPMVLIAVHFMLFTFAPLKLVSVMVILWVIVTFNSIWLATGMYLSLRLARPTFAVIANLLLALGLYLGVLAVLGIIGNLTDHYDVAGVVGWYAPYGYLFSGIDGVRSTSGFHMPNNVRLDEFEFLRVVFFVGVAHLVLAGAILAIVAQSFDRIVGRAPQTAGRQPAPAAAAAF
jgi:ABC-type transport system involved in multi-copper enzyme maturation permease subunit